MALQITPENGISEPGSNSGYSSSCSFYTQGVGTVMIPSFLSFSITYQAIGLNSKAD